MIRTSEYIRVTNNELEEIKTEMFYEALQFLIQQVPGVDDSDRTIDVINPKVFDKNKFNADAANATKRELKLAYQLHFNAFEVKTIPYESWTAYDNILIEVGKKTYDDQRGSLFNIKSDGWIHQLLDEYGEVMSQHIYDVNYLKRRYELLKHDPNNFIECKNENSEKVYCMPLDFAANDMVLINELEALKAELNIYKIKYEQFLNEKK
jgi:hypothetical protein